LAEIRQQNEAEMSQAIDLDTTLIFVNRSAIDKPKEYLISADDFADPDRSLSIRDEAVAEKLRSFAMQEMALIKIAVGAPNSAIEFFHLDLKRDKKAVAKLESLCSMVWLRANQKLERVREETKETFFSATLTGPIDAVVRAAELRQFLVNATNKRVQTKTGRSILLFHHSEANAPKEDIGSKPSSSPSQKVVRAA
jgi:hypothetical protein